MIWDTTDPHGWLYSRVWFTCISQFRKDICNKQDVPSWTHVILFFSVYIAVFTSCLFFLSCLSPKDHRHWPPKGACIVHRPYSRNCVTCWPPLSPAGLCFVTDVAEIYQIAISIFSLWQKKNDSPDWDVTRLTCPSFCLLNLCAELIWCVWGEHNDE